MRTYTAHLCEDKVRRSGKDACYDGEHSFLRWFNVAMFMLITDVLSSLLYIFHLQKAPSFSFFTNGWCGSRYCCFLKMSESDVGLTFRPSPEVIGDANGSEHSSPPAGEFRGRQRVHGESLCICSISLSPGTSYSFWELVCR